jgi:hypothetical protein
MGVLVAVLGMRTKAGADVGHHPPAPALFLLRSQVCRGGGRHGDLNSKGGTMSWPLAKRG